MKKNISKIIKGKVFKQYEKDLEKVRREVEKRELEEMERENRLFFDQDYSLDDSRSMRSNRTMIGIPILPNDYRER